MIPVCPNKTDVKMFKELSPLLKKSKQINMVIAATADDKINLLFTTIPKDGKAPAPFRVCVTAEELDEKLPEILAQVIPPTINAFDNIEQYQKGLKELEDLATKKSKKKKAPKKETTPEPPEDDRQMVFNIEDA